jgi:hypothetical protein
LRYTYRGITVESDVTLDSAVFHKEEPEQEKKKPTDTAPVAKKQQSKKRE